MVVPSSDGWKLVLAGVLAAGIVASASARAPRHAPSPGELWRLVVCALGLYALGGLASLNHRPGLAGPVYAAGIATCAFAAWLSRGTDSDGPGGGEEPADEQPPPSPDGVPRFDWDEFERAFRSYADRTREREPVPR